MKKTILIGYCLLPLLAWAADEPNHNWPQWRGPLGTGAAPSSNPPATWSETENIRWKVPIPGQGHASPIAWGDRVFVLTAIQTDQSLPQEESDSPANIYKFDIIALDRQSGNILWQRTARAVPLINK